MGWGRRAHLEQEGQEGPAEGQEAGLGEAGADLGQARGQQGQEDGRDGELDLGHLDHVVVKAVDHRPGDSVAPAHRVRVACIMVVGQRLGARLGDVLLEPALEGGEEGLKLVVRPDGGKGWWQGTQETESVKANKR